MAKDSLTVALISDVFFDDDAEQRLRARLSDAKQQGAELAVLPEIPLNRWAPATKEARDDDAEPPGGPRHRCQSEAAAAVGIGLVGGAIVRDDSGVRRNTALVFDAQGRHLASYAKLHVPQEPGFWEKCHYEPGVEAPRPVEGFGLPIGVQICSDINRPQGSQLLSALGCEVILGPRSTEQATYDRWRVVFRANALTCAAYVLSVNRPRPEQDVLIGGASFAVSPEDEVLLETTDPVGLVTVEHAVVERARRHYPGYLDVRTRLYAGAWTEAGERGLAARIARGFWEE
jgi:N-carbamoylputrescine amidase